MKNVRASDSPLDSRKAISAMTEVLDDAFNKAVTKLLDEATAASRRAGRPLVASFSEPARPLDPLVVLDDKWLALGDRLLWMRPHDGFALAGLGVARAIETAGASRFAETAAAWKALTADALVRNLSDLPGAGPALVGGFAFDAGRPRSGEWRDYPDGRMVLPQLALVTRGARSALTCNFVVEQSGVGKAEFERVCALRRKLLFAASPPNVGPGPAPLRSLSELKPSAQWRDEVRTLAQAIRRGELKKIVLARGVRLKAARSLDPLAAMRRLISDYPDCCIFAFARGRRCFLGATPERLMSLRDGEFSTMSLAGSITRGRDHDDDLRLAGQLLADRKEREEHRLVLDALVEALRESTSGPLQIDAAPTVLKLPNVQHLCTAVSGRLAAGRTMLEIVERFHPTPAVGGAPRETALRLIREREGIDRGWYAGPVGWLDGNGGGEFVVAIRSALLDSHEAILYAGCGIMADSDPESEFAESSLKLLPMLTALDAREP